jgi:SHS family lactate transporter-like MFS transporter
MGGIWGLASSTALENLPVEARGLASGVLQQGYAVGYLLAACINLTLVPDTKTGWRSLFWTASGISMFAAFVRAALPESQVFLRAKAAEKARGTDTSQKTKIFLRETKAMLKRHWLLCIYAVLLMTGTFASFSHFTPADASGFEQASTFYHTALRYVLERECVTAATHLLSTPLQDLYPTYLQTSKNFSAHNATVATIIGNCVGGDP